MPQSFNRLAQEREITQKTGTDKIFGAGSDGTVTISTNTSLSRDMYYANLTVNSSITLFTNGFKVFVSGTLTNNGTIGMPKGTAQTTSVMAGTVMTRIDSSASGYTASDALAGTLTISEVRDFDTLMEGVIQKSATRRAWWAGSFGTAGTSGTANAGGGSGANAGTAGTGGSAGLGGGNVIILAKTIAGSGTFVSEGTDGTAGNPGNPGNSVSGNPGHNPGGHNPGGHNPSGHAPGHNPGGNAPGHNPGGHNPPGHFHHPSHHTHANCKHNPGGPCFAHHPGHHNPCHQHVNPGNSHPGNPFHYSHPGNPFHYSHPGNPHPGNPHPGNPFHNPSYAGGTGNPGNAGNPGNEGSLVILTRGITTHVATSNLTYVEDLDD